MKFLLGVTVGAVGATVAIYATVRVWLRRSMEGF